MLTRLNQVRLECRGDRPIICKLFEDGDRLKSVQCAGGNSARAIAPNYSTQTTSMMKPVILFKNDFASESNSVEAHILFEELNYKTETQIKTAGFGYDNLEAVRQLIEGLNEAKAAIDKLISFATEVERLQVEENEAILSNIESDHKLSL